MNIIEIFSNYYDYFLRGTQTTIVVSIITVLAGTVLGALLSLLRLSKFKPFTWFAKLYITIIRGTPLLVQLYIVYYQLDFIPYPDVDFLGVALKRVLPCILALSINSSAYVAEVIRSGIQAVDFGQTEAALSCGMTKLQTMRYIVMPQAIKNILPALANEVVTMVKESSICSTMGMMELMWASKTVATTTHITMGPYVLVAILYFAINYPASKAIERLERRMRRGDK